MISGYSIAASIIARPDRYMVRCVKRIYPAYLFAIAFASIITIGGPLHLPLGETLMPPDWRTIAGNILMMQGTLVSSLSTDGALWSLSIEWWCYVLAIILIRFRNDVSFALMLMSFGAMITYYELVKFVGGAGFPAGSNVAMMAWAWLSGFVYFRSQTIVNFLFMSLLPLLMFDIFLPLQFADFVIIISAFSLLFAKTIRIESMAVKRALNFLGNASYPLYLLHGPMLYFAVTSTPIRNGNALIFIIIGLVLFGYYLTSALYTLMENLLKQKLAGMAT